MSGLNLTTVILIVSINELQTIIIFQLFSI